MLPIVDIEELGLEMIPVAPPASTHSSEESGEGKESGHWSGLASKEIVLGASPCLVESAPRRPSLEEAYRAAPQYSGNLQVDPEIHLPSPGMDVDVAYYYNSNSSYNGPFGYGRTINLNLLAQASGTPTVVSLTRGNGAVVSYQYDSGSHSYVPQTANLLNTLVEDSANNLWKEVTPTGLEMAYPLDTAGQLTSISYVQDSVGNRHSFSYNSGLLESLEDAVGRRVTLVYAGGLLENIEDWAGRRTTFQYDSASVPGKAALTTVTGPTGCQTGYGYAIAGGSPLLDTIVDPNGYATTYAYDGSNRVMERTVVGVGTSFYTYNDRQTVVVDAEGIQRINTVDENWNLQSITNGYGTEWSYTRNARGQETSRRDALGAITTTIYDSAGILPVEVIDPIGRRTTLQRDAYNNPSEFTYADGTVTSMIWGYPGSTFDTTGAKRRLQAQVDALGNRTSYSYNGRGQLFATENALGNRTTYGYDAFGNRISQMDPTGALTTFLFDTAGNVTGEINPLGRRTTTVYDAQNRVLEYVDPLGYITSFGYDSIGNLKVQIDPLGGRTSLAYNVFDLPVEVTDALGNTTTTAYDKVGRPVAVTNALGYTTTTTYDIAGRPSSVTRPLGVEFRTATVYDAAGRAVASIDPRGYWTTTTYDSAGRPIATTDALGNRFTTTYDLMDRPIGYTDPLGQITTSIYDNTGQLRTQVDALGNRTSYSYDAAGRQIAVEDARGARATTSFDSSGRVQSSISPLGFVTTFSYNLAGEPVGTTDALGFTTTSVYDGRGNLAATIDQLGFATSVVYDPLSRQTATIDANGRYTTTIYDAVGQVVAEQSARGVLTSLVYDALGQQRAVIDANGHITTNQYDIDGRLTGSQDPLGRWTSFAYDKADNLTARTDARLRVTTFLYDPLGRTTTMLYVDASRVVITYDALGQETAVEDDMGRSTRAYDALGRVTQVVNAMERMLSYAYDATGNRTAMRDANNELTHYSYDLENRLIGITNPFGEITTFAHDALDRESGRWLANGVFVSHSYDAAGQEIFTAQHDGADAALAIFTTSYDSVGNRVSVAETVAQLGAAVTSYSYDADYQLIGEERSGSDAYTLAYGYDGAGNRLVQDRDGALTTYAYDAANEMLTAATDAAVTTYQYDANGNRTRRTTGTEETQYTWNDENRLATVLSPNAVRETFTYSSDGLRQRKATPDGTVDYLWDEQNILQETLANDFISGLTYAQYTGYPGYWGGLASQRRALTSADTPYLVEAWADQSGEANNATQADDTKKPHWIEDARNGQPALRFGSGQEMSLPSIPQTAPAEIFIVYNASGTNSDARVLLESSNSSAPTLLAGASGSTKQPTVHWGADLSYSMALEGWNLVRFRLGASDIGISVNGAIEETVAHSESTLDTWNRLCAAATQEFEGDIAEILIYNAGLTADERTSVQNYLGKKYDISIGTLFSPSSVSGLQVWFDPGAGVSKTSDDYVVSWTDQANGYIATQGTANQQPRWVADVVSGWPVIRFDGSNDNLRTDYIGPGGSEVTVFVVAKCSHYQSIVRFQNSQSSPYLVYPWGGSYLWVNINDGGTGGLSSGLVNNQWNVGTAMWKANTTNGMATWRNSTLVAQRNSNNSTLPSQTLCIGMLPGWGEYTNGDVAEILVYNAALSSTDREAVENYLLQKYGNPAPGSIAGLKLWLKADAGVTKHLRVPMPLWTDRSGEANNAVQTDTAKQPLWIDNIVNGKPVVRFSGAQEMNLPDIAQSAPSEIFVVYNPSGANSDARLLLGADNSAAPQVLAGASGSTKQPTVHWDGDLSYSSVVNGWNVVRYRLGTTEIGISVNGGAEQTVPHSESTLAEWNRLCHATLEQFEGDIAEILVYSTSLSTNQRTRIENYLKIKYAIGTPTPTVTSNLRLWLSADAGVTKDGNNLVSAWADQSVNGYSATQATGSKQPLWVAGVVNGKPALRFDGTSDTLGVNYTGPGGSQITIAAVVRGSNYQSLVRFQSGGYLVYPWGGAFRWINSNDGGTTGLLSGLVANQWNVGVAQWKANTAGGMATWRNGTLVASRTSNNTTLPSVPLWIGSLGGSSEYLNGDVCEILIYDAALSENERVSVEEYLGGKYGLIPAVDPSSVDGLKLWLKADVGVMESDFYGIDNQGHTRVLTSGDASVLDTYLYDGYGELLAGGSTRNAFRYGGAWGYYFDEADRMDARMRLYDPTVGRWLSRDPISYDSGDWNLYLYVRNNPVNDVDPSGLQRAGGGGGGASADCGVCGPDVTTQVLSAMAKTRRKFAAQTLTQKQKACNGFISKANDPARGGGPAWLNAWDTINLYRGGVNWVNRAPYTPSCTTQPQCKNTVEINGKCFYSGTANYVTFGVMWRLCRNQFGLASRFQQPQMLALIDAYKRPVPLLRKGAPNWGPSREWAIAGYGGWPTAATPAGDRPNCFPTCKIPYNGAAFDVYWYGVGYF